jgi:8-oxo-dGTP pyrophosphatase MutT (NUDIX family)
VSAEKPVLMVVGLLFNAKRDSVLLIRKNRPAWMTGLYNGVGGHMEEGETPGRALAREVKEEVGIETDPEAWRPVVYLSGRSKADGRDRAVWFLTAVGAPRSWHQFTDEAPYVWDVNRPDERVLSNLHWIIPLAARADREGVVLPINVQDTGL